MPIDVVIGVFVLTFCIALFMLAVAGEAKKYMKKRKTVTDDDFFEPEGEIKAEEARVISRRMSDEWSGNLVTPKYHLGMYVTFLTFSGESIELPVTEEIYAKCIPDTVGTLVTVGGQFFDFGNGEDTDRT